MRRRLWHLAVVVVAGLLLFGAPQVGALTNGRGSRFVDMAARPSGGYWVTTDSGIVAGFGGAPQLGGASNIRLRKPIVGIVSTPSGNGYWLAAADGGVFTFGDAAFRGSAANLRLNAPISSIDRTGTGNGYWLLGQDGGIFTFGDAAFLGRAETTLSLAVGLAATPVGQGYSLARGNSGPINFGNAAISSGVGVSHGEPFVDIAMTPNTTGGWLAQRDGTVNSLGDAPFYGDVRSLSLQGPISAIVRTPSGRGYWLLGEDGGIFTFGDAPFAGRPEFAFAV